MKDWVQFRDSRLALQFRYPALTTDGEPVEQVRTEEAGMLRFHILAPKSREGYFEVTRYDSLSVESEYQWHRANLPLQFDTVIISELRKTSIGPLPAYEYSFEWEQGARVVLLIDRSTEIDRILYNPRFPVNLQILASLEWLNPF